MAYRIKEDLQRVKRTRVGIHAGGESDLFLDRNERAVPYDTATMELLAERLKRVRLNLYPDLELFYEKLSRWLGLGLDQIFITEGVSGAVKSLIEAFTGPGNNIVFPIPTFALYKVYCDMFGIESRSVGYKSNYALDFAGLLKCIDENTAMVFLPNPNVPIEGTLDLTAITLIAERCVQKKAFLVIDEVYYPFGGPTAISLISRYDNVFVMRSFSKAFGLAGIRVGYLMGAPHNIEYVSKVRTGYETNSLSVEAASFFIENYGLVEKYVKDVREGLAYLKKELSKRGLECNGGETSNFIFVNLHDPKLSKNIIDGLKAKSIHIRGGWADPYSGGFSVTGAPKSVMQKFTNELFSIMDDIKNGR